MLQIIFRVSFCLSFLLLIFSCTKDEGVIDKHLAVKRTDLSVPTNLAILAIDTISENDILVAASDKYTLKLFRSSDCGLSWTAIPSPVESIFDEEIQSLVYMDEESMAVVVEDLMYRTYNGGATWYAVTDAFGLSLSVFFACKYNNQLLFIENNYSGPNNVYTCDYHSSSKQVVTTLPSPGYQFKKGHLHQDNVIMFSDNYNADNKFKRLDLTSNSYTEKEMYCSNPRDVLYKDGYILACNETGLIKWVYQSDEDQYGNFFNYNTFSVNSLAQVNNYLVAVGEESIYSNINGSWEPAISPDLSYILDTFYTVIPCNDTEFFLGGTRGKFYKASFQ